MNRGYRRRYNNYVSTPTMDNCAFENSSCNCIDNMYNDSDDCECGFGEEYNSLPNNPMLAQSYVPWQIMNRTFTPEVGLCNGTIFPELAFPYVPGQSKEENEYLNGRNEKGGCNNE